MTTLPPFRTAEDLLFHRSGMAFPALWVEAVCGVERPEVEPLPLRLPIIKGREAEDVLERRQVVLYPFVPLMRRRTGVRVLLAKLLERIIQDVRPGRLGNEVRVGAFVLALRRFSRRTVERVFGGIEDMARTETGHELIEMGRKRGLAEGVAKGVAKGLAEGRADAMRAAIFAVLEARFGRVSADVRRRVKAVKSEAALHALHRQAVTVESVSALLAALRRE